MYYGLKFPHAEPWKTIHNELTTYLLPEQTYQNEYRNNMKY